MKLIILGKVTEKGKRYGYMCIDEENGRYGDVTDENLAEALRLSRQTNDKIGEPNGLCLENNRITFKNGSIDRYNTIEKETLRVVEKRQAIVIISQLEDADGKIIGYKVANIAGKIKKIKYDELKKYKDTVDIANGKWVEKDSNIYISAINGSYDKIVVGNKNNIKKRLSAEAIKDIGYTRRYARHAYPVIRDNSAIKEIDDRYNMTVEEKIAYCMDKVNRLRPFYFSVLECMQMIEADERYMNTMGVAMNRLYFSSHFVKRLTLGEITFVLLHEVCHVAMCHESREGNREHQMWNAACDLYINKLLQTELELPLSHEPKKFTQARQGGSSSKPYEVTLPSKVLFVDNVDIYKDTPESIYETLIKNRKKDNQGQGQGQSQQSKGQQGQGHGKPEQEQESDDTEGSVIRTSFRGQDIAFNKKTRPDADMVSDDKSAGMTEQEKRERQRADIARAEQVARQTGRYSETGGGELERFIKKALAPKIDWRKVLKSWLTQKFETYNTFSSPDRRWVGRGVVMPGPRSDDNGGTDDIKVCVDVSGSISNEDLGIALAQIKDLLETFKAKAEVIFWHTSVCGVVPLNSPEDVMKCKPDYTGGTNCNCVFEYFETERDYKTGRKAKPDIIIIFTDGYFNEVEKKYARKYGRTLYVINGDNEGFKPSFGKVAPFKNKSEI